MNESLERLKELCLKYPLSPKYLISESLIAGNELLLALARSGHSWVNLRVSTAAMFALEQLSLRGQNFELLNAESESLLIEQVYEQGLAQGHLPELSRISKPQGLWRYLRQLFSLLRKSEHKVDPLVQANQGLSSKIREVFWIYAHYEQRLKEQGLDDSAKIFEQFVHTVPASAEGKFSNIALIYPGESLSPLVLKVLQRAARIEHLPKSSKSFLLDPPQESLQAQLCLHTSLQSEVKAVFQTIASKALPLEEVELRSPSGSAYGALLHDYANLWDLPFSDEAGLTLEEFASGRFLKQLLGLYQNRFAVEHLAAMLSSEMFVLKAYNLEEPPVAMRAAMWLYDSGLCFGRSSLEAFSEKHKNSESLERQWLALFLEDFLNHCPALAKRNVCASFTQGLAECIAQMCYLGQGRDLKAWQALEQYLKGFTSLKTAELSRGEWLKRLDYALGQLRVLNNVSRDGALRFAPLESQAFCHRKHLFVLGMNDQHLPGKLQSNPLISDAEKVDLGLDLPSGSERLKERLQAAEHLLAGHEGCLYLSAQSAQMPSPLLLKAYRATQGNANLSYEHMLENLPTRGVLPLEKDVCLNSWDAFQKGLADYQELWPELERSVPLCQSRHQDAFGSADGYFAKGFASADPRGKDWQSLSCSSLETLASCPQKYWLKYIVRLKPLETARLDPALWLSPLEQGNLLHELYFKALPLFERGEEAQAEFESLLDDILQQYARKYPAASAKLRQREEQSIRANAMRFWDLECLRKARKALYGELAFGRSHTQLSSEMSTEKPAIFHLPSGKTLAISGSIDRVDINDFDSFEILDYKTGSSSWLKRGDLFQHGEHLQPFVYALALPQILKVGQERVLSSAYYFSTFKGRFEEVHFSHFPKEDLLNLLEQLCVIIEQGLFAVMNGKDTQNGACRHCDMQRACSQYQGDVWSQKYKNDQRLEPVLELLDKRFK